MHLKLSFPSIVELALITKADIQWTMLIDDGMDEGAAHRDAVRSVDLTGSRSNLAGGWLLQFCVLFQYKWQRIIIGDVFKISFCQHYFPQLLQLIPSFYNKQPLQM